MFFLDTSDGGSSGKTDGCLNVGWYILFVHVRFLSAGDFVRHLIEAYILAFCKSQNLTLELKIYDLGYASLSLSPYLKQGVDPLNPFILFIFNSLYN